MHFFTVDMGIPAVFALLAITAEFFGGIGLIVGFLSRIAAFGIAVDMLVAVCLVHVHYGVFMNWYGNQKGEGYEYHLLAISLCILIWSKAQAPFPWTGRSRRLRALTTIGLYRSASSDGSLVIFLDTE